MAVAFLDLLPIFDFELIESYEAFMWTSTTLQSTMHVPFIFSFLYVLFIFGIQHVMENKEPFDLRNPLALWSLLLGLFSVLGSLRTVPLLFKLISKYGVTGVICDDTRYDWVVQNPAGMWTWLFVCSKVPELIDTFFIVLRKRKLITLHWYHHITVMLFCWHSWATHCLYGIFFAAMNLTVHACMYIFYFLAALGYRPTKYAISITMLQIVQMLFGTAITFYAAYHMTFVVPQDMVGSLTSVEWNLKYGEVDTTAKCKVHPGNVLFGVAMYSSYLWLFCVFFYHAYLAKPATTVAKKTN